jgi:glutathione S-transferase
MERKIVVYGPARSPFVEKVTLGLAFKGFGCEVVEPQDPEDYRRWNPETGLLPVMDFEGTRVPDSTGILDWLDQRFPEPPFQARDPWTARSQRMLESWIGETFFFYWVRWVREQVEAGRLGQPDAASEGGDLSRLGILGRVAQILDGSQRNPGSLGPEFDRRLDDLVGFLGRRPFFYAERPGRTDLTAVAFLRSLETGTVPDGERQLARRPALLGLMARVRAATTR